MHACQMPFCYLFVFASVSTHVTYTTQFCNREESKGEERYIDFHRVDGFRGSVRWLGLVFVQYTALCHNCKEHTFVVVVVVVVVGWLLLAVGSCSF
jgi:hypothetical protein